jgi:hypothetical protein
LFIEGFHTTKNTASGWKGLPGTNTLAYYEHSEFTDIKDLLDWNQVSKGGDPAKKLKCHFQKKQGILTEGIGSVQLTSLS